MAIFNSYVSLPEGIIIQLDVVPLSLQALWIYHLGRNLTTNSLGSVARLARLGFSHDTARGGGHVGFHPELA